MTYLPALGAIDASNFNSTRYPGVCKPTNKPTMDAVVLMQNQLNRVAHKQGITKIAPDGDVGPATVGLVNKVKNIILDTATPSSRCIDVAQNADLIANNARMFADTASVPASVSAPKPARPPSFIAPSGKEIVPPPPPGTGLAAALPGPLKNMSMPMLLLLGAAVIGAGYYFTKKAK